MSQIPSEEKKPRRKPQARTYESEVDESEEVPSPLRRKQRQPRVQQGALETLDIRNVQNTADGLVNTTVGVLDGVTNTALQDRSSKGSGKRDTLRLRLDLNLDVEITLKAKIHGDLELALL
jgi:hypothetical protein